MSNKYFEWFSVANPANEEVLGGIVERICYMTQDHVAFVYNISPFDRTFGYGVWSRNYSIQVCSGKARVEALAKADVENFIQLNETFQPSEIIFLDQFRLDPPAE